MNRLAAESNEPALEITRVVPAARSIVFVAFVDPAELTKWFGPKGFRARSLEFDARIGESYRLELQPPQGDPFFLTGEFREVHSPVRLAYTFVYENPDPD